MSLHQRFLWTRSLAIVVGLGVLALLLWAPRSQAATVSQTLTGSASGPLALTFDHFDASLGDLESVTVELSASATGQPSITLSC
ncbi:MAG: choice-of-anchor E domain-containing protein, partial [Phycisphaerae bacterium]|nr:choice-of-anchor E domain-containing protein [Phycisphaerae bacterium]